MIGVLVLAATLAVSAVTLTVLGYWWGYGKGRFDASLSCELGNELDDLDDYI